MFTLEGRLKITDFGLARFDDGRTVTMDRSIRGTLTHIAPECVRGLPPDRRADIFAFGVVLYETAAGELPFRGENPAAVLLWTTPSETGICRATGGSYDLHAFVVMANCVYPRVLPRVRPHGTRSELVAWTKRQPFSPDWRQTPQILVERGKKAEMNLGSAGLTARATADAKGENRAS